jgi:HAD superfamily hydrolase (TIGR01490 family)
VVGPLAAHAPARLAAWRDAFAAEVAPRLPGAMHAVVAAHRDAGDLCAVVTATSRLVAEPFARAFGNDHLVATEPVLGADGRPSGGIDGLPCFREHKPTRVRQWLAALGTRTLPDFDASWFYSDSISDLPLLLAVTHPVAVRPDPRLRAEALKRGWRVVD